MAAIHPHVKAVIEETGENDPVAAVRAKTRVLIRQFIDAFGEVPPFNLEALASFRGLMHSQDAPRHSLDSEIAPEDGRVVLRVNRERPVVRQRFSIGHEIGHTLFPDYQLAVQCRKPPERDWADPRDQLEMLCDIAASEILFPSPWFDDAVAGMALTASGVRELANRYNASPEATIRRLIDVYTPPAAAIFLSWKLKPTEIRRQKADRYQGHMFEESPPTPDLKLRVDYSIMNDGFRSRCCDHIPKDKSVPFEGPIQRTVDLQDPQDGDMWLDLGTIAANFRTQVLPIYTPDDRVGPSGAGSVVVLVQPCQKHR